MPFLEPLNKIAATFRGRCCNFSGLLYRYKIPTALSPGPDTLCWVFFRFWPFCFVILTLTHMLPAWLLAFKQYMCTSIQIIFCAFIILNSSYFGHIQIYYKSIYRSSRPEVFCKKGVLRNFAKFTGKHLRTHRPQASNFIKKETQTLVFSCEFCEISKNTFFNRIPLVVASESRCSLEPKNFLTEASPLNVSL